MGENEQLQLWCSWLSRSPHTREVPGSSPGSCIFVFINHVQNLSRNTLADVFHHCFLLIVSFDELFKGYYNLIFFIEKKRNIPFCLFLWEDALIFDDGVVGVIVVIVIIVWMGSGLCPGATKDIIQ